MLRGSGRNGQGFNSTLVRLKEAAKTSTTNKGGSSFNSTLVRLKGDEALGRVGASEFQFHTGSIEGCPDRCKTFLPEAVSIPHWFD